MNTASLIIGGILALALAACDETEAHRAQRENYQNWDTYRTQRKVALICRDGTRIWLWRDKFYVSDSRQYPDAEIVGTPENTCAGR